jgi:ATP adenylyltransferase
VSLERLWAGWRASYVSDPDTGRTDNGCVMCNLVAATDDVAALVIERTPETIAVMNLYPYGSGHLMVAPIRHVASLEDLDERELIALSHAEVRALKAIRAAYSPDGVNMGVNIGRAAGAGVPNHLHVHLLPRWSGDTNFMTSVAEARVMAEDLPTGYEKLKAVWGR